MIPGFDLGGGSLSASAQSRAGADFLGSAYLGKEFNFSPPASANPVIWLIAAAAVVGAVYLFKKGK